MTTNIRLTAEAYRDLSLLAARRRVPVASLVRDAIAEYLVRPEAPPDRTASRPTDPVDALVGSTPFAPADEALNHDHYLYGWPKEDNEGEATGRHRRPPRAVQPKGRPASTTSA